MSKVSIGLLFSLLYSFCIWANTNPSLIAVQDSITPEATSVTVYITANDLTAITSISHVLIWDADVLQLDEKNGINHVNSGFTGSILPPSFNSTIDSTLSFTWSASTLGAVDFPDGDTLYSMTFNILQSIGHGTRIHELANDNRPPHLITPTNQIRQDNILIDYTGIDFYLTTNASASCERVLIFEAEALQSADYKVLQSIISRGSVTILSGSDVLFQAGEEVLLEEGFVTQDEVEFLATIGGCDSDTNAEATVEARQAKSLRTKNSISIFPNPASDRLHIVAEQIQDGFPIPIRVYSARGQLVLQQDLFNRTDTINIENLEVGMYFLLLGHHASADHTKLTFVIVK
ncbi:MAG: 3-coathanger stack domain-containing protein [Bacteroidota bacterium]